jgi:TRAP-type C4-dicarboxylate transport system permease small subunit
MRIILNIFLFITIIVIVFAGYNILHTYFLIKHEIKPVAIKNLDILEKATLFRRLIISYWTTIFLCILVIILILDELRNKKNG